MEIGGIWRGIDVLKIVNQSFRCIFWDMQANHSIFENGANKSESKVNTFLDYPDNPKFPVPDLLPILPALSVNNILR